MNDGKNPSSPNESYDDDDEFCDKKLLAINHLYNNSSEAILSVKGTVRGIRNRVRAGIKTFAPEKVIFVIGLLTVADLVRYTVNTEKPKWIITKLFSLVIMRDRVRSTYDIILQDFKK